MDKRILIIDDVGLSRKLVEKKIAYHNGKCIMDILCASYAEEALNYIKNTNLDAVICDIKLPDMSGFDLYRKSIKYKPHLPFVFITALNEKEFEEKWSDSGVHINRVFFKPLDFEKLKKFVYSLMRIEAD
ncbi:MAG: response regulator [Spirochaetes bacterium]|nr:response regulator [Spirochaetota bacterium]